LRVKKLRIRLVPIAALAASLLMLLFVPLLKRLTSTVST